MALPLRTSRRNDAGDESFGDGPQRCHGGVAESPYTARLCRSGTPKSWARKPTAIAMCGRRQHVKASIQLLGIAMPVPSPLAVKGASAASRWFIRCCSPRCCSRPAGRRSRPLPRRHRSRRRPSAGDAGRRAQRRAARGADPDRGGRAGRGLERGAGARARHRAHREAALSRRRARASRARRCSASSARRSRSSWPQARAALAQEQARTELGAAGGGAPEAPRRPPRDQPEGSRPGGLRRAPVAAVQIAVAQARLREARAQPLVHDGQRADRAASPAARSSPIGSLRQADRRRCSRRITRTDPIWVRFALSEAEYAQLRDGDSRRRRCAARDRRRQALPGAPGKLNFAGSAVDRAWHGADARRVPESRARRSCPASSCACRCGRHAAGDRGAAGRGGQQRAGRFVWSSSTARRRSADAPAAGSAHDWVVLEGLKPGDTVIVDNLLKLRPGAPVTMRPAQPAVQPAARGACIGPALGRRAEARPRNVSRFFIHRPVFAGVIAIIIVLAGLVAAKLLPVAQYPEIAPPTVIITTTYPGASAETLAQDGRRADRGAALRRREAARTSARPRPPTARCTITATFEPGTNVDQAVFNVNNRVQIALPRLPDEVRRNGVIVQKRSFDILLVVVAASRRTAAATRCSSPTTPRSTWSTS